MVDPDASLGRRAWLPCPRCARGDCAACRDRSTCGQHWLYLLDSDAGLVFVQCPRCLRRWWHDTGHGVGRRPRFPSPVLPEMPDEAA